MGIFWHLHLGYGEQEIRLTFFTKTTMAGTSSDISSSLAYKMSHMWKK